MPWIIPFIITWVVFFILVDKTQLKRNLYGGLLAFALATLVDWGGTQLGLYKFTNLVIPWFGCSLFYKFGPIVNMGILFAQSVPRNRWLQLANIFVFALLFVSLEYLLGRMHVVQHLHWNFIASLVVNILTFATLTFITTTYIRYRLSKA